jgi:hypothetical protein
MPPRSSTPSTHPRSTTIKKTSNPVAMFCDWPFCSSQESFSSLADRSRHVADVHITVVLENWPGPGQVANQQLDSILAPSLRLMSIISMSIRFFVPRMDASTLGPLENKPTYIDTLRLFTKLGRYLNFLKRPVQRYTRGFPRKDKLNEHISRYGHGKFYCSLEHCPRWGHKSQKDLLTHEGTSTDGLSVRLDHVKAQLRPSPSPDETSI